MGCCKKKKVKKEKAAGSLAPSDKYHRNPQGGHHRHTNVEEGGGGYREGGEPHSNHSRGPGTSTNNNNHFSHNNGITPSRRRAETPSSANLHHQVQEQEDAADYDEQQQYQLHQQQLIQNSPYHFYPSGSFGSVGSITSSSLHQQQQHPHQSHQQPPYLVYKSRHSSSSGNGSHIIDGSNNGSIVEGSNHKYYYYYNGYYYPATVVEEGAAGEYDGLVGDEQIFTITATTKGQYVSMGRVGEDVYHPPGSPANISGIGANGGNHHTNGSGLFKSKSGSIPVTGSPLARGFRDTFVSSMSPAHALSAESSPLHRSASANTANSSPNADKFSSSANNNVSSGGGKQEGNKKWTFGGLFRRNKTKGSTGAQSASGGSGGGVTSATSNNNSIVVENGGAHKLNNNNYGNGSPLIVRPVRTYGSPARPASSVGFVSVDPKGSGGVGHSETSRHSVLSTSIPPSTPTFVNAESQTRAKGKLSESDISTCDSDFELALENPHDNPPEPAPQENSKQTNGSSGGGGGSGYKQNFLVRRLSRRKEKAAAKKQAALAAQAQAQSTQGEGASLASASNQHHSSNGFISSSSQQHGHLDLPQMKQRVGSSPDSLNNSSEPWPSWETTRKPQTQLQALQHQHRLLQQNYSSNGSLSLSQEGGYNSNNNSINSSNNLGSKSSKAAAKEAVKARAIARRESFLRGSSSSEEDTEERSQSSLQGSFSSLNSRNRRQRAFNMQQAQFQQHRHLFPATSGAGGGGISCASPSSPMPVPLDYRNSVSATASPNMNRRLMMMGPPGSPKWDARLIYQHQQEGALSENGGSNGNQPVRLPRKGVEKSGPATSTNPSQMSQNNGEQQSFIMATEMISEDQHVVTAGLKVPFLPVQNPQQAHQDQQPMLRNGQLMYPDDPVQYANVANGMRGQSSTPYTTNTTASTITSSSYNNAIHHASPTPPPPPPPRRAPIGPNNAATNPNFYRPVSCSYLDSYANQLQQLNEHHQHHHPMRQQSPMIFNGNYIYPPQMSPSPQQHYQGQSQEAIMNGVASHGGIARSSPRRFAPSTTSSGNNNQPDVDSYRHPPLIRSPSEPPTARLEQARISSSPVKRLLSSPMSNGNNSENNSDGGAGKNAITSKLGFPVRRLQEASKLTGPQGPVHLRASEFWRKKENEVATAGSSSSPVGGNGAASSPHQKKYLSRIRSADSSPLPVPKMRKSPGGVVASNESISSLSSFSENAASPGPPKNCSSPINPIGILKHGHQQSQIKATPLRAQISKTPNPQQLTYGNSTKDKENNNGPQQKSAVERLKVRIPSAPDRIKSTSSPTNPPCSSSSGGGPNTTRESASASGGNTIRAESNNNPIRSLIELNNGKTPGKNLEDALNELEDMYKSLRLSDEDLLDRAERRDLPTPHQELRDAPLIPIPQAYHRFEHLGSVESLGTGSGSSGTNYTGASFSGGEAQPQRVRAPPLRRSSRPDTVTDDMANRRLAFPDGKPLDPRLVVAKTGSYLARSPAFSPCSSPCPLDGAQYLTFPSVLGQEEPDLTLDDVTFRNYKRANAIRIIDPQPLFGIPLGPISAAPANDYLHSKPSESYRPIFGNLKTPDVVNDDIAFRNLRKDLGQDATLGSNKDWTPRLFSPNRETSFNYPNVKDGKKLRAIRSLSANITHMIPPTTRGSNSSARYSPTSPFRHSPHQQPFKDNIGKWSSSYSDLHKRASSYLQPSWVEQIEKVQTSTETLTDHRNSSRLSTAILDPPEHWERKFPKKTVELTPPIYDPDKPRRPWTDIILESFEKEKQKELERIAAEAEAAANGTAPSDANNKTGAKSELEGDEDDDVFMDASDEASKSEALPGITQVGQSANTIKISGNGSKNNDPERSFREKIPNMDTVDAAQIPLAKPLPLLPGPNNRRGSWVEPSRSYSSANAFHASEFVPATAPVVSASHPSPNPFCQDKRRKSWSDLPKDIDSFSNPGPIILSGTSCSASPTRKLFNPLPPPKKIRQINLEAFNNNNSNSSSSALSPSMETPPVTPSQEQVRSNPSPSNDSNNFRDKEGRNSRVTPSDKVKSASFFPKSQGDELNEIMDQLLRDANACTQSIRDKSGSPRSPRTMKGKALSIERDRDDKGKSISPTVEAAVEQVSINTQRREMKMDEGPSSSGQSGKQDLSCMIVGSIPKQPSPPREEEADPDRNNQRVENQKPTFSTQKQVRLNSSPEESDSSAVGSRQLSKIDNGKGSVNVPKEKGNSLSTPISQPIPIYEGSSKSKGEASSIEDLIESINESLPELEASCGVPCITTTDSNTHSSEGKQSGSPSSSIPSPSPGSPIPPILSVSLKEIATNEEDDDSPPAAFPVPAKRHHLPSRSEEESLYENLPVRATMMKRETTGYTGNDEKFSSSSPFTYNEEGESYIDPVFHHHHDHEDNSANIPQLVTISREDSVRRSSSEANRRAPHGNDHDNHEADGDNEEEETQHSTSSSHQPSSLSSNDSSEVCGSGSPKEAEENRKEERSPRPNNSIKDNINTRNQVDQTCSTSSTLPPSLPTTNTASSSDTLANQTNNNTTETNRTSNSSLSSSRESLLRKKSEGFPSNSQCHSNERDDCLKRTNSSLTFPAKEPSPGKLLSQAQYKINKAEGKEHKGKENSGNANVSRFMSRLSSSSVEEPAHPKQNEQRPVAPSRTHQQTKSSASTGLAATPSATEVSASETSPGTGMSFLRNNFPFFRNSTSRSRSQSVISDVSRSSETGVLQDSKKEKDKSYRRKSHLNRAFTDEPVPDHDYAVDLTPKSSKPTSHEVSSLESSAVEEGRIGPSKPNVKIHPAIPPVLNCTNNKSDSNLCKSMSRNSQHFDSTPSSPLPLSKNASVGKLQTGEQQIRKSSPVVKKDSFSDAEGVSFIKKMLQKESDRDRAAAAAAGGGNGSKQNSQSTVPNGNGPFNIKKSPSAGNQSYWSKFSSSQSAFLRKLFEKPKASEASATLNKSSTKNNNLPSSNNPANNNLNNSQSGEETNGEKDSSEKENAEPVLGFSVAQKASFFMKLEHEQRFSKWRKNSVDLGEIGSQNVADHLKGYGSNNNPVVTNNTTEFRSRSSRHFTQPVTPTELKDIPLRSAKDSSIIEERNGRNTVEFGSQPAIYWGNSTSSNLTGNGIHDSSENNKNPSTAPKSFYKEYDDMHKFEPIETGNFKKRDNKYDGLLTGKLEPIPGYTETPPTPTLKSYSLTRSSRNPNNNHGLNHLGGFPMYHSASAIINTNAPSSTSKSSTTTNFHKMPGNAYSSSSSSFSEAMSRHDSTKFIPMTKNHNTSGNRKSKDPPVYENGDCQRRGSVSDLELLGAANQCPLLPRAEKVKSMFISRSGHHCDPENLSEDGEFSSGGQEVAEIICRSYENSPVFRKKNWRTPKHAQANFTKEIWRRCGNYDNWSQRTSANSQQQQVQPQHPIPQTFTATTNVIEVSTAPIPSTYLPTVAASPPPTTSNLLQILTVLSSSNDELSESKSKRHHRQQGGSHIRQGLPTGSSSIPPSPCHRNSQSLEQFRRNSTSTTANLFSNNSAGSAGNTLSHTMPQAHAPESNQIFVSVPHPEDEAFQSFFCSVKSYTQVTHYPTGAVQTTSCVNGDNGEQFRQQYESNTHPNMANSIVNGMDHNLPCGGAVSQSDEAIDISSVRREGDLLVMKKNIPSAKRKTTNGKYKNPLRALAARMDFRQQGYTQQSHSNANNSVHCSSDVDVTT